MPSFQAFPISRFLASTLGMTRDFGSRQSLTHLISPAPARVLRPEQPRAAVRVQGLARVQELARVQVSLRVQVPPRQAQSRAAARVVLAVAGAWGCALGCTAPPTR